MLRTCKAILLAAVRWVGAPGARSKFKREIMMNKARAFLPLAVLSLGLAACGGGQQNETVANEATVTNSDESLGNAELVPASENDSAPANLTGSEPIDATGNAATNAQ
jgi:hypothetical protein